jgi:hypothetical protein
MSESEKLRAISNKLKAIAVELETLSAEEGDLDIAEALVSDTELINAIKSAVSKDKRAAGLVCELAKKYGVEDGVTKLDPTKRRQFLVELATTSV